MAQQTAVERFITELESKRVEPKNVNIIKKQISINVSDYLELKRKAKEMFQQQIEAAWKRGDGEHDEVANELSKKYYTTIYGK